MTALTDRQVATLRALLAERTLTPDRAGLVEAWATLGDKWARANRSAAVRRAYGVTVQRGPHPALIDALAAMRNDNAAWAETVRRLEQGAEVKHARPPELPEKISGQGP